MEGPMIATIVFLSIAAIVSIYFARKHSKR